MEKRLLLAVLLMSATVVITNLLFPPPEPVADSGQPVQAVDSLAIAAPVAAPVAAPAAPMVRERAEVDTIVVHSPIYNYAFSTAGGRLVEAELLDYPSYTSAGSVQLVPAGGAGFLSHRLAVGADTIDLSDLAFHASAGGITVPEGGSATLELSYAQPDGFGVVLVYTFDADRYLVGVEGRVSGISGPATLLTDLGPGLSPHEAPDHRSEQQLEFVVRGDDGIDRFRLAKVSDEQRVARPLTWAGLKDKYFLAAVVAGDAGPLTGAVVNDLPDTVHLYEGEREPVAIPRALLTMAVPVGPSGQFSFDLYLGPQEFDLLGEVGYDLENVTQYAYRWLEPVIRPVAAAILWVLKTLHDALGVAYGWVLVLFGVLMRVVLWPLNAKAMRAQMKNMAVQPLMQEIREKYKDDPQRQQAEMMKLMKEQGFNPLAGCFPLLIPFPVLITLFFVFQNTIAFRGANFLWLPDLSLRDPLYVLPFFLVVSMFALQLISARASGMESNPQMKMMMYFMPIMMGVIFFNLPAGLNLYYATTNVASIPQQLLIARERKRARVELEAQQPKSAGKGSRSAAKRRGGRR